MFAKAAAPCESAQPFPPTPTEAMLGVSFGDEAQEPITGAIPVAEQKVRKVRRFMSSIFSRADGFPANVGAQSRRV